MHGACSEATCAGAKSQGQAQGVCQEGGAQLCTAEELQNDEARGTECSYDGTLL